MKYKITTLTRTIPADLETPVAIYLKIRDLFPKSALLESSDYHTTHGSVSLIGIDPIAEFRVAGEQIIKSYPGQEPTVTDITAGVDVVDQLHDYIASYDIDSVNGNGMLGYTAYDAVRYFESVKIQPREAKLSAIPDMLYILYRFIIRVNHYKNEMTIIENICPNQESNTDELIAILHNNNIAQYPFVAHDDIESPITDQEYCKIVEKAYSMHAAAMCSRSSSHADSLKAFRVTNLMYIAPCDASIPHPTSSTSTSETSKSSAHLPRHTFASRAARPTSTRLPEHSSAPATMPRTMRSPRLCSLTRKRMPNTSCS